MSRGPHHPAGVRAAPARAVPPRAAGSPLSAARDERARVGERASTLIRGHWSRANAWAGVGASLVALALIVVGSALGATLYGAPLLVVFPFTVLHCGAIPLALVRPRAAAVCSIVASAGILVVAHAGVWPWPWTVTAIITQALVSGLVGYRAHWRYGVALLGITAVVSGVLAAVVAQDRSGEQVAVDLVVYTSIAGVVLVGGIVLQRWGAIRAQLLRERRVSEEERARRMLAEEKTRIARELHDVIAHSMSLISVQAASAPYRLHLADDAVREEFEDMAASSRRALSEMRSLLSVLRDENSPRVLEPQPGLDAIPTLVERVARSGADIELVGVPDPTASDAGLAGVAAYRIVQEAVSNALRHVDHPRIVVRVRRAASLVEVEIDNDGGRSPRSAPRLESSTGTGLVGMRERAIGVGGSFEHRTVANGGYEVRARLPVVADGAVP